MQPFENAHSSERRFAAGDAHFLGFKDGFHLAQIFADQSNITLRSSAFPWWVYVIEVLTGLLLPLLAASVPIVRASTMTVREAVSEIGMYSVAGGGGRPLTNWLSGMFGPTLVLAMRNVLRRQARLGLALGLLAVGGGTLWPG